MFDTNLTEEYQVIFLLTDNLHYRPKSKKL